MEKVKNVMSVWDNGETWPLRAPVYSEVFKRGGTEVVRINWEYRGIAYALPFNQEEGYGVLDTLPDETGFIAMKHYHALGAHILNGDTSVRFVLKPQVNMRGFDAARLAVIEKLEIERAYRSGEVIKSWQPTALFHYKTQRQDCLEIFGDDGFGDCFYRYDTNTGELLSAETHPRRS